MKEKYKRRIQQFAEQSLEKKLEQKIRPFLRQVPYEIRIEIKNEIMNLPLPDEESLGEKHQLGSKLQSIGRDIADNLLNKRFNQIIPFVEEAIDERKERLASKRVKIENYETKLLQLKVQLKKPDKEKKNYWRGDNVIITPTEIPQEGRLARARTSDIQVITETDELAYTLTWLFIRIEAIMDPFLPYIMGPFYSELADTANRSIGRINNNQGYDEHCVLINVLSNAERLREGSLPRLKAYLNEEENELKEADRWISKNRINGK